MWVLIGGELVGDITREMHAPDNGGSMMPGVLSCCGRDLDRGTMGNSSRGGKKDPTCTVTGGIMAAMDSGRQRD